MFQEFLKNKTTKQIFKYSILITIFLFIFMGYIAFYTSVGLNSGFTFEMINLKVIDINYVFFSNLKLILLNLLLGILTCGLFTIFSIVQNVYTLSIISNVLVLNNELDYILKILPHGIFEIFTLVFTFVTACYSSLKILSLLKKVIQRKNNLLQELFRLARLLIYHVLFIIFLLFIAVLIEFLVSIY